jgi:hypothetical protein
MANIQKDVKDWILVHQTEHYESNENPHFRTFSVKSQQFCSNNSKMPIKVCLFHHHSDGSHKEKGHFFFSIDAVKNQNKRSFKFMNTDKQKEAGDLIVLNFMEREVFPFTSYLAGGLNMSLVCCVDFTGSNGAVTSPKSLHYIDSSKGLNQYQQAILSVGDILMNYDYDKMVGAYGFGGLPKGYQATSHFFPLNGNPGQPEVYHTKGVFDAYNFALHNVQLSGPTKFSEITKRVSEMTKVNFHQHPDNYTILLILTDGVINDMDQTIDNICEASEYPMSIIIIGIGTAEFD